MMKKILLSGFVVLSFILYSYHQTHEDSSAVTPPSQISSNSGSQSQNSGSEQQQSGPTPPDPHPSPSPSQPQGQYKDGSFTGSVADAYYGYVQVMATIKGGKITDVKFLQYPNDRRNSQVINAQAMPYLTQEAITAQSANVDGVSGATDTSTAFKESLSAALAGAKI